MTDIAGPAAVRIALTLNGAPVEVEVETGDFLLDVLRERLGLTGSKRSCDSEVCGACTVLLDGLPVSSCTLLAWEARGRRVETIEGLAQGDKLHPMQAAFREHHALQCGFCTPGMIMSAVDLVKRVPDPSEAQIREWLEGNICRCTGYHNIVAAVREGARALREGAR